MYLATEALTIVRHIETLNDDQYISFSTVGSWKNEIGNDMSRQGESASAIVTARIPEEYLPPVRPAAGDYIVRGIASINSLSDLKGKEYFRVTSVRDNLRGVNLRHLAVIGNER